MRNSLREGQPAPRRQQVLVPVRREALTPEEYRRLTSESQTTIARARYVPPQLGDGGFGRFEVEYSIPILKRAHA